MDLQNEQLLEIIRDPKQFLELFTKIKGKEPGLIPFILNPAQIDLFNALNSSSRVMILKARQLGISTAAAGYLYHMAVTTPGVNVALIGYNSDLTAELLDKVKTFWRTTPEALRPTILYNSKFEISFPSIDSKILVLPSSENVGRGYTLFAVLITELAFIEKAEEKMIAIENAVPAGGKIIIESTPNGIGNLYHRMWMADNGYAKKEYGWWWGYSEEEIEVIRKRMNNPMKFAQEYGLEFLASGRNVFDMTQIKRMRKDILKIGDVVTDDVGTKHTVLETEDHLRIYQPPRPGRIYVAGADVAEGVTGGDFSTCTIFDRLTGEEVAMYRGVIPADKFGVVLNRWGLMYNKALMVVEINNHGLTTVTTLRNLLYPQMYFRPTKFDAISSPYSDRLGWKTTKVTRPLMIDDFAEMMRAGSIIIHSEETLDEMMTFVFDTNNAMTTQSGFHDDCLKKGTLIKTNTGYKEIENIVPGDLVLTHKGRYQKVEKCIEKPFAGEWYDLDIRGQLNLELSYNHPLRVATGRYKGSTLLGHTQRQWKYPGELKRSYKALSIIEPLGVGSDRVVKGLDNKKGSGTKPINITLNKDFAKFLGLFLAEGHAPINSNQLTLAFHERDMELLVEIRDYLLSLGLHVNHKHVPETHCRMLTFCSKTLSSLLASCYDASREKMLPWFAHELGENLIYVLEYWLKGDGWVDATEVYDRIGATTSKKLALSLRDIAWSAGYYAMIHKIKRHRYEVTNKDQYYVSIKYTKNKQQHLKQLSVFEYSSKIKTINKTVYSGTVYNLQVEEDRSFVADGVVVHNCIFATAICLQGFKSMPDKVSAQIDYTPHLPTDFTY